MSDVSICNRALHKLGASSIVTLNDNNEKARVLRVAYDPVRKAELRRRRWRFALKRASLPALTAAPVHGFDYKYQVPTDFLRLVPGGSLSDVPDLSDYPTGMGELYSLEGLEILTDLAAPLDIRYIANIADTGVMDVAFQEVLAARLAMECCFKITESTTKKADLRQDYIDSVKEAIRANALEVASVTPVVDSWVAARLG